MKKYLKFLVLVAAAFILTACDDGGNGGHRPHFEPALPLQVQHSLEDGVHMEVTYVDLAAERVMVTIFNNSSYTLFTGLHFVVEVFDGNIWRVVPWRGGAEAAFADVAYIVQPG
ncbi:MAG: hypothetical protein FWC69_00565, partial [Defluviitaleaceae bacterium]|nr:hypothetical protein [Defluviitaleaceae bacterium]